MCQTTYPADGNSQIRLVLCTDFPPAGKWRSSEVCETNTRHRTPAPELPAPAIRPKSPAATLAHQTSQLGADGHQPPKWHRAMRKRNLSATPGKGTERGMK